MLAVEGQRLELHRHAAEREEDARGSDELRALRAIDRDRPGLGHTAGAGEELDLVLAEERADPLAHGVDNLLLAGHHGGQVEPHLPQLDAVCVQPHPAQLAIALARLQQRLAGDTTHVQTRTPEPVPVHAGHLHAQLRSAHRGRVSTGSGAYDD